MKHTNGLQIGLRQRRREGYFLENTYCDGGHCIYRTARTCLQQNRGGQTKIIPLYWTSEWIIQSVVMGHGTADDPEDHPNVSERIICALG